jgi:hypothetical protein
MEMQEMRHIIDMLARIDVNMKTMQEKMDATQEETKTNQAKTDVNLKETRK